MRGPNQRAELETLKLIRGFGWVWLTRLKANRLVNPDWSGLRPVARTDTDAHGAIVHLKGYGLIRLFKIVLSASLVTKRGTGRFDGIYTAVKTRYRQTYRHFIRYLTVWLAPL